jgi:radical SAM superfamily enzyme YgiQ (UPF0313 family)
MRICFVLAPVPFLSDPKRNAPLGTFYLAAAAERAGHETSICDWRDKKLDGPLDKIPDADVYGFTATTPEYPYALALAARLKAERPCIYMLGGFHPSVLHVEAGHVFDSIVSGEAEELLPQILEEISHGATPLPRYTAPGLVDIEKLPLPARHLLPKSAFISTRLVDQGKPATTMLASRGCPSNCHFCASRSMWKKLRYHSPELVLREALELRDRYGAEQLRFSDAAMSANPKWLAAICHVLKTTGMPWRCSMRVDQSSPDLLATMLDGGCNEVCYGVESIEQNVLDRCNKKITVHQTYQALKAAKSLGLRTRLFLIAGLPGQTNDTADKTIKFIQRVQPDAINIGTLVPLPGSELYANPEQFGITLKPVHWEDYVMTRGLFGDEQSSEFVFTHDVLSEAELQAMRSQLVQYARAHNLVKNG